MLAAKKGKETKKKTGAASKCLNVTRANFEECRVMTLETIFENCKGRNGVCVQRSELLKAQLLSTEYHIGTFNPWFRGQGVESNYGFFALVAFLAAAVVAAVVLMILAVKRGFWVEKKPFLAILAVVIGTAITLSFWTLVSTGYQDLLLFSAGSRA